MSNEEVKYTPTDSADVTEHQESYIDKYKKYYSNNKEKAWAFGVLIVLAIIAVILLVLHFTDVISFPQLVSPMVGNYYHSLS